MKKLTLIVAMFLSACGSAGSSSPATGPASSSPSSQTTYTYTLTLTGDNVQSAPMLRVNSGEVDQQEINPGPVTIPVGGSLTYTLVGRSAESAVTRISAGATNLDIVVLKDGNQIKSFTLTTAGTYEDFGSF